MSTALGRIEAYLQGFVESRRIGAVSADMAEVCAEVRALRAEVARLTEDYAREVRLVTALNAEVARLEEALRLAAVRLAILTARMRGCHEETGKHELLDEAEMFVQEARAALAERKEGTSFT